MQPRQPTAQAHKNWAMYLTVRTVTTTELNTTNETEEKVLYPQQTTQPTTDNERTPRTTTTNSQPPTLNYQLL